MFKAIAKIIYPKVFKDLEYTQNLYTGAVNARHQALDKVEEITNLYKTATQTIAKLNGEIEGLREAQASKPVEE